jgi:7,8-dihydro-6-hydroxymethylpterin-pyrophosphokinase
MKSQHQVILSRTSGNKLETIQACIALIHKEVGTVIQVSKVTETPSWGFESDAFIIAPWFAYVHTLKSLEFSVKTREKLGRTRNSTNGYQSNY